MLFYVASVQSLRLALVPIIGDSYALPILELKLEDLQDNILATIEDELTATLEALVAESIGEQN